MIEYKEDLFWCRNQLKIVRNKHYFDSQRRTLTQKLFLDLHWREKYPVTTANIHPETIAFFVSEETNLSSGDRASKQLNTYKHSVKALLEIFTQSFFISFTQRLATCRVIARENRLTMQALESELLTGTVSSLAGIVISQSLMGNSMGAIPSIAASARTLSAKLFVKKRKAKKITKYFDSVEKESLIKILCEVAVHIFYSYECQFMHITDQAGSKMAMEKLAYDAVDRAINYLNTLNPDDNFVMSSELLEKAILQGPSEKFIDPSLRMLKIQTKGKILVDDQLENKRLISTSKLYEKVGLITFDNHHQTNKFYKFRNQQLKYGYRRLLNWEKDENEDLKQSLQAEYVGTTFIEQEYDYVLTGESQTDVQSILDKINNPFSSQVINILKQKGIKKIASIIFDLREPVSDFTGRVEIREKLHRTLTEGNNLAVISGLSAVSISLPSTSSQTTQEVFSGSQLTISGLGGIGKTQLALQYAKEHAADYDHNVLWINAETKENLFHSFTKLANKLELETKDRYGQDKNLEEIVEAVYEYFSDRKSLFILDNVENYRAIEAYLPKAMRDNTPTILITSRFANWNNVATIFSLDAFTDLEALELCQKSLGNNMSEGEIKNLNVMLQGLPLALKQAIAYINLQKKFKPNFSVNDYINLYKEKSQKLLNFNFSNYVNDPYLKTVFTTWLVTLDKIQTDPEVGQMALELLALMSYLDPVSITSGSFYALKDIRGITGDLTDYVDHVDQAIFLLTSYSMINFNSDGTYAIHRLVQEVQRINIENDPNKFEIIVKETQSLFNYHGKNLDDTQYLHFLLYMS